MLVFHLAFLLPSFLCFGGPESSQEYQEYNDSNDSDDSDDGYIDAYDSSEYDDDDSSEYYDSEEYSSAVWPSSPSTPTQHCPCSQESMAAEHSIRRWTVTSLGGGVQRYTIDVATAGETNTNDTSRTPANSSDHSGFEVNHGQAAEARGRQICAGKSFSDCYNKVLGDNCMWTMGKGCVTKGEKMAGKRIDKLPFPLLGSDFGGGLNRIVPALAEPNPHSYMCEGIRTVADCRHEVWARFCTWRKNHGCVSRADLGPAKTTVCRTTNTTRAGLSCLPWAQTNLKLAVLKKKPLGFNSCLSLPGDVKTTWCVPVIKDNKPQAHICCLGGSHE